MEKNYYFLSFVNYSILFCVNIFSKCFVIKTNETRYVRLKITKEKGGERRKETTEGKGREGDLK